MEELLDTEPDSELLNEFRLIRAGAAILLSNKSKRSGDKVVQHARKGQSNLTRIKSLKTPEDKLDSIAKSLDEMFDCMVDLRFQLGSCVGVTLASVLISERSTKEITKILKQRRR